MRAERLLRILLLLQACESLTAGELARRLEVSARTIQRDLDSLSLAGVPVYASRGRGGGWTLARDYHTRLNGLTPAEAMTVFVGTTAHVLADLGLDAAAGGAFAKLLSALPSNARKDAQYARARVLVDYAGWQGAGEASPHLAVLRRALWEERRVQVCYSGRPLRLAPLGLVAKGSTWYLVAARDDGEIRTYRVSKITSAVAAEQTFKRPHGFDLAAHWASACDRFFATRAVYPVRLRVQAPAVHRLSWAPGTTITEVAEHADGWSDVTMTFENAFEAATFLLGMAGEAVVVAPDELRDRIRTSADRLALLHAGYVFSGGPGGEITLNPRICPAQKTDVSNSTDATGVVQATPGAERRCVAAAVILYAAEQLGKPYQWGGTGPGAFDCSGLAMMAYRAAGVAIPRTSQEQRAAGPRVPSGQEQPGDLVFFAGSDGTPQAPGHVGIVIGIGEMIEAYATGFPIRISTYGQATSPPGDQVAVGFTRPV